MDQKGQMQIIDTAIMALVSIMVLGLLLAALWPMTDNFLTMSNTTPNYSLWRPVADFLPAILVFILLIVVIRRATGQEQRQY